MAADASDSAPVARQVRPELVPKLRRGGNSSAQRGQSASLFRATAVEGSVCADEAQGQTPAEQRLSARIVGRAQQVLRLSPRASPHRRGAEAATTAESKAGHSQRLLESGLVAPGPRKSPGPTPRSPSSGGASAEVRASLQALEARLDAHYETFHARLMQTSEHWLECRELLMRISGGGAPTEWTGATWAAAEQPLTAPAAPTAVGDPYSAQDIPESVRNALKPKRMSSAMSLKSMSFEDSDIPLGENFGAARSEMLEPNTPQVLGLAQLGDVDDSLASSEHPPSYFSSESGVEPLSALGSHWIETVRWILGEPMMNCRWRRLSDNVVFDRIGMIMTAVNCIIVAVEMDWAAEDAFRLALTGVAAQPGPVSLVMLGFKIFLCMWLFIEILVHLVANRSAYFLGRNRFWNCFDIMTLLFSIVELATTGLKLSFVRVLRIARSAKAMQAFRSLKYSATMQKIVLNMRRVFTTLFWALVLLFIVIFTMSIILMEGVIGHMERAADRFVPGSAPTGYETAFASVEGQDNVRDLYLLYGGIGKTFTTLFRAVTGADWSPFAAAMSSIGWAWGLLWSFYIFVVMLGTFNIVNGLFIDIFMKPLPGDHAQELAAEELLHRRLCKLLVAEMKALGKNPAEDPIGRRTFRAMLKRERLSNKLIELGISLDAEREPFHIIDTEGHGELTPAEVATQILDVRGGARGIDLARVVRQVTCMRQDMATLVATLLETTALRPDAREEGAPIKTAVI